MPTREEVLYEKTYKNQVDDLERRVFYTLTNDEKLTVHRTVKAVALLVKILKDKQLLTEEEIDKFLLETIS